METFLAIASVRAVRDYDERPLPDQLLDRILQAGRATGSSQNRQPWRFIVVTGRHRLDQLSDAVYAPDNLRDCAAAIAVVVPSASQTFDAGRAAQNMVLAAWDAGIGSCPNGVKERALASRVLELEGEHVIPIILSLGFPKTPLDAEEKTPAGLLERIDRKPLAEFVRRLT